MSKNKLENGDIWESDFFEQMIIDVIGNVCCKSIVRNKRNGNISYENTDIRTLQTYNNYKGKAKYLPSCWFEVCNANNETL
ncbi:MAG: hypothetical protein IJ529_02030 [Alphaproteobacteria bacterium]|nr:hypothetical protein [Alphaproteobacteria bacterium]MBR1600010.1 hypothetical protein [Alphaproteobacteria bacterium]